MSDTTNISADQVRQKVQELNIVWWALCRCSICNSPIGFIFGADRVVFDSNCDCTRYYSPPQPRDYSDVARQFNMQTHPGTGDRMWQDFLANSEKLTFADSAAAGATP